MKRRPTGSPTTPTIAGAVVLAVLATLATLAGLGGCGKSSSERPAAGLSVADALGGGDDSGFRRAVEPPTLRFPADHGPHPGFRTEWWYLTGNLETATGRHFGYQATFFRTALTPQEASRESAWATSQIYMAHFALTDTEGRAFHSFERFGRGALGLAGARGEPLRVWIEDWELAADAADGDDGERRVLPPLRLRLATAEVAIDLRLEATKPIVLHGDRGLSRKGTRPGNASYYYSFTRLASRGSVRLGEREIAVTGNSWMDREWSTSVLEEGVIGWDWLSLQLDDGSELMYFLLRRADGAPGYESGTVVAADGATRPLGDDEVQLVAVDRWQSPLTGAEYPSGWRLRLPAEGLELEIRPRLAAQELIHSFSYWEGAVEVSGRRADRPVAGVGYVELTGYQAGADGGSAAKAPRGGAQGKSRSAGT